MRHLRVDEERQHAPGAPHNLAVLEVEPELLYVSPNVPCGRLLGVRQVGLWILEVLELDLNLMILQLKFLPPLPC